MDKVIVSNTTIKFNFSLKELVENYPFPREYHGVQPVDESSLVIY